jgi:phosphate transport system substrate-binding protein
MNRFAILIFLAWLPARAATNQPPASGLLLDEKAVFDLTAGLSQYETVPQLSGKLASGGSGLVTILLDRWASEFGTIYPDVALDIQGGGSSASLPAFLEGKMDLMPMSRPLWPDELKQFKDKFGYEPSVIIVAQDAVGVYVNENNPLARLTLSQLDGIYSRNPKRGGVRSEFWRDLGVTGALGEERIARLCLSRAHGTHLFFRDAVMLGEDYRFDVHFEVVSSSVVQGVGADDAGIGFCSVMFATQRTRFVPLQATNGAYLLPSYQNIIGSQYPLTRPMRIVFNRKPDGSMNPVAKEFLRFALSRRGQRIIALAHTYPLTIEQQQKALQTIGENPGVNK